MKYLKIGIYELYAFAIIAFATGLRVVLAALGWPPTNADEGTMGIMARHIAYRGEHPLLFYGQNYMGSLEAYLGALFFHLFGPSLFALRLGVILLVTLFFISTYLLASLLYSKKLALVTLALLSFGSIPVFTRQMIATGGSSQTLLFGSVAFLLAAWLSLSYQRKSSMRTKVWRLAGYTLWGLAIGLGVWSDLVVLPFFAMAGLLLLLFCWRELLLWAWSGVLVGFVIGALPIIDYNIKTARVQGQDSLHILLGLFHGSTAQAPRNLYEILHGVKGTVLVSIPTATGSPFCPVLELPFLGDNSPHTPLCTLAHAGWGLGYLTLLVIALLSTVYMLWRLSFRAQTNMGAADKRQVIAQLILLGSAVLAITLYAFSSAPMGWPGFHARYLVGLLIVTPALIAPLWSLARGAGLPIARFERTQAVLGRVILALIGILLLIGTFILFSEVPAAQATHRQSTDLINHLTSIGATHIYTDYWTCDSVAFQSEEHIICGVLDGSLQPSHNRDPRYYATVSADPHSAYVFAIGAGQLPALEHKVALVPDRYRHFSFDGYVVYQPK